MISKTFFDIMKYSDNPIHEWIGDNAKNYEKFKQEIAPKLPNEFSRIYLDSYGFHDYFLKNILIKNKCKWIDNSKENLSLAIHLCDGLDKTYEITYSNVKRYYIEYFNDKNPIMDIGSYYYDKFLEINEALFSHEIIFIGNEINTNIYVAFSEIEVNLI